MGRSKAEKKQKDPEALPVGAITIFTILALVIMVFFAMLFLFRVKKVEVTGNVHESDREIRDTIMVGPMSNNTLLLSLFKRNPEFGDNPFIDRVTLEYTGRNSVRIRVSEKSVIGYVAFEEAYWYFNEDGIVEVQSLTAEPAHSADTDEVSAEEVDERSDDTPRDEYIIPYIEGLTVTDAAVGSVLPVSDPSVFSTIASITGMINKNGIWPDRVTIEEDGTWTMTCGTIKVLLGKDEHLEDKIEELAGILPQAGGLSGTLHLENFDGTQNRIIFDKAEE